MRSPRRGKLVQAEALKVVPTGPAQGHGPHGDGLGAYTLELPMAVTGREKSGLERYDELFLDIVVSHLDDLPVVAENEALEQRGEQH
jgi:hypothetical protein